MDLQGSARGLQANTTEMAALPMMYTLAHGNPASGIRGRFLVDLPLYLSTNQKRAFIRTYSSSGTHTAV